MTYVAADTRFHNANKTSQSNLKISLRNKYRFPCDFSLQQKCLMSDVGQKRANL